MDRIIDFLRLLKLNNSTDIIYFERIVEAEINRPVEIFIENDQIKIFHKITGSDRGIYTPSENFKELADCFIEMNKPTLKIFQIEAIRTALKKFGIKKQF